MTTSMFTTLFLIALAAYSAVQLWLANRHMQFVTRHRDHVPEAFAERIDLAAHQKAADYTLAKTSVERIEVFITAILLLGWTLGGGLEVLNTAWSETNLEPLWIGTGFLLSLFVIMSIIDIPMSLYRTFVIEERFGFNHSTLKIFFTDQLKQLLLLLAIGLPLIALVLWLMGNAGELWWFWVWAVWTGFGLVMMWAYPAFIAPLFNTFSALEEGSLRERIQDLLTRCGFTSNGIFVIDGSRRSGHGNAYFSGLGQNKRIVFFDTLIESLSADEIEAVLAHELGHFRRKHIVKRIISMAIFSLAGLAILGWLVGQEWFYMGLGISTPSLHAALALFLIAMPVFTFFLHPLSSWFSRKHEFEADAYAAEVSSAEALTLALVKLYEENASTLTPDPLYSAFHDSHPPAAIRIEHLTTIS